ncbi:MAG: cytochrome B562 [Candidatus Contendobacter sp.]|jgi:cytochrome b561|nr:MAG: cytochrome B562 [Candidatus Contendobacter sp.]CAG1013793.1 Cytochrome b561 [Rhizobiaceae bacterium]
MTSSTAQAYRPAQIVLHWFVMLGVIVQIAIHEPMVRETTAQYAGLVPDPADATLAMMHGLIGSLVFLAVLVRLWLRYRYGVPGHPQGTSSAQAVIAGLVHNALYLCLLGVGFTGMLTRSGVAHLGDLHFYINIAMFTLILLHAGAALFNQFVRKDGTLTRMIPALRLHSTG